MSDVIDWSKAPEGATHFCPLVRSGHWRDLSGSYGRWWNNGEWFASCLSSSNFKPACAIARPQPTTWSGEGLLPVGTLCEWFSQAYGWLGGKVVGHDGTVSVIAHNDGYTGCHPHEVRPIRTPEQFAADKREAAVDEMAACAKGMYFPNRYLLGDLYDAGYRKQ